MMRIRSKACSCSLSLRACSLDLSAANQLIVRSQEKIQWDDCKLYTSWAPQSDRFPRVDFVGHCSAPIVGSNQFDMTLSYRNNALAYARMDQSRSQVSAPPRAPRIRRKPLAINARVRGAAGRKLSKIGTRGMIRVS